MPPRELLFLIGPRGSGKTTVAALLAESLGWAWVDADAIVEERAGCSIRDIFAAEGEAGFRAREAAVLEELCGRERAVIATGGGVVLRPENRRRLREAGHVVWLRADCETLWRRISTDGSTGGRRPALLGGGPEEVAAVVAQREPLYRECAHAAVETAGRAPAEVAAEVLAGLAGRGARGSPNRG
jgi:shikimate kinase